MLFEKGRKQKQTQEGRKAVWVDDTIICTLGLTCVRCCRCSATSTLQGLEGVTLPGCCNLPVAWGQSLLQMNLCCGHQVIDTGVQVPED